MPLCIWIHPKEYLWNFSLHDCTGPSTLQFHWWNALDIQNMLCRIKKMKGFMQWNAYCVGFFPTCMVIDSHAPSVLMPFHTGIPSTWGNLLYESNYLVHIPDCINKDSALGMSANLTIIWRALDGFDFTFLPSLVHLPIYPTKPRCTHPRPC